MGHRPAEAKTPTGGLGALRGPSRRRLCEAFRRLCSLNRFKMQWRALHADHWDDCESLGNPGVYLLAHSSKDLEGRKIEVDDVYYVGMSNSAGGVRARLKQLKTALEKGRGHSAGDRWCRDNGPFSAQRRRKQFYFAALCLKFSGKKSSALPEDFKKMGQIACLEYYAIARVRERSITKKVPPLNRSAGAV